MICNVVIRINGNSTFTEVSKYDFVHFINTVDEFKLGKIRVEKGKYIEKKNYIAYQYYDKKINEYVTYAFVIVLEDEEEKLYLPKDYFIQDIEELPFY